MIPRSAILALLAGLLVSAGTGADELLDEITQLARGGTPGLALRLLDRHQPSEGSDPQGWMRWERERIDILRTQGDWRAVLARLRILPQGLPGEFRLWVETVLAEAELELGRGAQARRRLAQHIWGAEPGTLEAHLAEWRRLIIRSYLAEGRVDDAYTAMLRYRLDYSGGGEDWLLLSGRVLLEAGRPQDAANLLARADSTRGRVLYLLAASRAGLLAPAEVRSQALAFLEKAGGDELLAYQLWGVLAESSRDAGADAEAVRALERGVALRRRVSAADAVVTVNGEALWEAYERYAQRMANANQLLVGSFDAWLALAERAERKDAVASRALYAFLASHAVTKERRLEAHRKLVTLLLAAEDGASTLRELYLESGRYPEVEQIPKEARYALVDQALSENDIELASRLIGGLTEPPQGMDASTWHLRRARLLVLGGQTERGVEELRSLIAAQETLVPAVVDQMDQVIFDLQTLGEHEVAYQLFASLLGKVSDPKLQRKLIYWMADSVAQQGRHEEAARLYLKSAAFLDTHSMGPWAQTARYQAATELAKAGLSADAQGIYESLVRVTTDPARRAALHRAAHRLLLAPNVGTGPRPTRRVAGVSRSAKLR